ncbi:Uncharacterized protein APZ42_017469 [Daphnia magna]|uniref:Uncharacterized protein n=1 Tax=Daphnia magna TaxID=35525 RepID=A0A162CKB6_9CRUS|nr:Uncharacterized protein APZ42_017469 [Daphnia magna]
MTIYKKIFKLIICLHRGKKTNEFNLKINNLTTSRSCLLLENVTSINTHAKTPLCDGDESKHCRQIYGQVKCGKRVPASNV